MEWAALCMVHNGPWRGQAGSRRQSRKSDRKHREGSTKQCRKWGREHNVIYCIMYQVSTKSRQKKKNLTEKDHLQVIPLFHADSVPENIKYLSSVFQRKKLFIWAMYSFISKSFCTDIVYVYLWQLKQWSRDTETNVKNYQSHKPEKNDRDLKKSQTDPSFWPFQTRSVLLKLEHAET